MAALDNFRINDPNFQNTADELANRAYWEGRDRGLSHLDALKAMEKGPMGLNRDLLSVTGTKGDMHGYVGKSIRDSVLRYKPERLLPPPAQAAPALTPSHLTGTKMGSAPQPALQTGAYAPELPVNDVERPLTEAQKHARLTEPAVTMFTGADGNLYPAGHPMLTQQDAILSDNTDETGNYTDEARAALLGPTANEIRDNRRSGIMMNQDPARYAPDGSNLDDGMGNIYSLEGGDKDDVFQSLVKRFLDEGFGREESIAKAIEQMEKPALQLLKENSAELGTFMMDKLGPDGERNYWPYIPFENTELGRYLESKRTTEAREALPSMQDAQRMLDINDPIGRTGGALTNPSTDTNTDNGTVVTQAPQTDKGVLTNPAPSKPTQSTVRSTTGGYTGNARGSDLPDMQIGLNERLMRMGAAGLAAGGQGSLAQMGAMFGASADVNQANRQAEMEAFGIEEERRQAHAARVAALAASKNKGAGGGGDEAKVAGIALDNARAVLRGFDKYDGFASPVGWSYWIRQGWDNINGNEQAAIRLKIAKMKVDSTLARVAQTKGAISEKEMDIFMSDQPSWTSDEKVWRDWIDSYIAALTTMHTNLSTGQTPYKNGGGGGSTGKEVLFTAPNGGKVFAE
jgi:hypothetical protein